MALVKKQANGCASVCASARTGRKGCVRITLQLTCLYPMIYSPWNLRHARSVKEKGRNFILELAIFRNINSVHYTLGVV